jgi:hypothetical protein
MYYWIIGYALLLFLLVAATPWSRVRNWELSALYVMTYAFVAAGLVVAGIGFANPQLIPAPIDTWTAPWLRLVEADSPQFVRPGWGWIVIAAVWTICGIVVNEFTRVAAKIGATLRKIDELAGVLTQVQSLRLALGQLDQSVANVKRALSSIADPEPASDSPSDEPAEATTEEDKASSADEPSQTPRPAEESNEAGGNGSGTLLDFINS